MTTISHEQLQMPLDDRHSWFEARDMWASLAIAAMWLAVLFDAVYGPDIVSVSATSSTRVPSAVVVALFAWLATRAVARYGFGHDEHEHG